MNKLSKVVTQLCPGASLTHDQCITVTPMCLVTNESCYVYVYFVGDFSLKQAAFLENVLAQVVLVLQQQRVEAMLRRSFHSLVGRLLLALSLDLGAFLTIDGIQQTLHNLHARRRSIKSRQQTARRL